MDLQDTELSQALDPPYLNDHRYLGEARWLTFDACKGVLLCRSLKTEYEELIGVIVRYEPVRVLTDGGGHVRCSSDDCKTANRGRPGRTCGPCEDRGMTCRVRGRIWIKDVEHGYLFAHTLSVTGTMNFVRYSAKLQTRGRLVAQEVTCVFSQRVERKRTGLSYRNLQFDCASAAPTR